MGDFRYGLSGRDRTTARPSRKRFVTSDPWVLVGLTATPEKKTPRDQIIFRYPLAAAILDKLVKTPVIVRAQGRPQGPTDQARRRRHAPQRKARGDHGLRRGDGSGTGQPRRARGRERHRRRQRVPGNPRLERVYGGQFADCVLVVHSKSPDEALEELAKVEDLASPVRIIISVGMLKQPDGHCPGRAAPDRLPTRSMTTWSGREPTKLLAYTAGACTRKC